MMRCLAAVPLAVAFLVPADVQAKRVVTAPAQAVLGNTFTVATTGWRPGERLHLYLGQPNTDRIGHLKSKRADQRGRAKFAVRLRPGWMVGRLGLVVRGGKTWARRASRRLTVHGVPPEQQAVLNPDDGALGSLALDRSTEQDVLSALGPPSRAGRTSTALNLTYVCGARCRTEVWINSETRTVSDLVTTSPRWRTPAGTTTYMSDVEAAHREDNEFLDGCLDWLRIDGEVASTYLARSGGLVAEIWFASRTNSVVSC